MTAVGEGRAQEGDAGELCSYAMKVAEQTAEATGATQARSRPWAGLTSQEAILISVERLLKGEDVDYLVSHETIHYALLHASALGLAQLAVEALSSPLNPAGVISIRSRQCLKILVEASKAEHEICATVWPQANSDVKRRERYWADLPASYRELAQPVAAWLDGTGLPGVEQQKLMIAMGEFALGCEPPAGALVEPGVLRAFFDEPQHHPGRRFELARAELEKMRGDELTAIAAADSPPAALAAAVNVGLGGAAVPYAATPANFRDWYERWQSVFWDVVSIWLADPRPSEDDRSVLPVSREQAITFLQPPNVPVMQTLLTRTFSVTARAISDPRADDLFGYPLCLLTWNGLGRPFAGFEKADGSADMVGPDQAAVWLYSPSAPLSCAVVGQEVLTDYVKRLPDRSTLCVADAFYLFLDADVIAAAPIVRSRRHLVIVEHTPLGSLIEGALLSMGLARETRLEYTTWQGTVPGVSYFLFRPAERRTPVVVAPVPAPTAERALRVLGSGAASSTGLEWVHVAPDQFVDPLDPTAFDLVRFAAWFEDQPWPGPIATGSPVSVPDQAPDPWGLGAPPTGGRGGDILSWVPSSTMAKIAEAGQLEARGKLRQAERGYRKLMRSDVRSVRAAAAISLGFLCQRADRLRDCVAAWQFAAETSDPDLAPYALLQLGQLFQATWDLSSAVNAYLAAAHSGNAEHAPPAALCLALLFDQMKMGDKVDIRALLQWVVDSGHPDVAQIAAQHLAGLG